MIGLILKAAISNKIFETDSSFRVKWRTAVKVQFLFFNSFFVVLAKWSFWQGARQWAFILWGLDSFLIFPNFLRS